MEIFSDPQVWVAFFTLLALELVLGVDNVIFISILAGKLPPEQRQRARTMGLLLAVVSRILLLFSITWIVRLTQPLFEVFGHAFSGRDLILLGGGLFLMGKAVHEMHNRLEGDEGHSSDKVPASFGAVIAQILLLDVVFSLDSVITAVGMVDQVIVMVAAVLVAVAVMLVSAGAISGFVERHPTVKMLALAFLLLIGVTLIADGLGHHIPKGYIYFSMGFSVFVEMLNLRARSKSKPVHLRDAYVADTPGAVTPKSA